MPRLPPSLFRKAAFISPDAATLLPACRDIPSSIRELRWIKEHVASSLSPSGRYNSSEGNVISPADDLYRRWRVSRLCRRRGSGVPLQYVLGTQPFGHLEMKCRKGVLIPRPEPEAYTTHLAHLLKSGQISSLPTPSPSDPSPQLLSILDLCTGTGCIALLLHSLLAPHYPSIYTRGVDISPLAISLSRFNASHNHLPLISFKPDSVPESTISPNQTVDFRFADMFSSSWDGSKGGGAWDIITCNPPYISPRGFAHDTARAVRNHEPKLAQVPGSYSSLPPSVSTEKMNSRYFDGIRREDIFYARLLQLVAAMPRRPKVVLCEVGDIEQAKRVVEMVVKYMDPWQRKEWDGTYKKKKKTKGQSKVAVEGIVESVEIWNDCPDIPAEGATGGWENIVDIGDWPVVIKGTGHGRSVFIRYKMSVEDASKSLLAEWRAPLKTARA